MSKQPAVRYFRRSALAWAEVGALLLVLALYALPMLGLGGRSASAAPARPAAAEAGLPPELAPWADWVRGRHPDRGCVQDGDQARCVWQGVVSIDLRPGGADFVQQLVLDRAAAVPLIGGPGAWPTGVREGKALVPVLAAGEVPTVHLGRGAHVLQGSLRWSRPPSALRVPPSIGVLRLSRDGKRLPTPTIGAEGDVRLGAEGPAGGEDATLGIDVSRRIVDDVPVLVVTHIAIRASGDPREVDLGQVLLAGATAVQLDADLPARLDEEGRLSVQVRPGSFFVEIRSIQEGPVLSLSAPTSAAAGWPEREFWVLEPDEGVRAVEVSGAPGIDPQRASLPEGWQGLATWMMAPGATLTFKELRRGQPVVAPNLVDVERRMWLDPDGGGWTIADSLRGVMAQGWRVQAAPPLVLGSVRVDDQPQVITSDGVTGGVEVRSTALALQAESRIEGAQRSLPAVGWATEARDLSVLLMLPPGWRLLTALGPDEVQGAWLLSWSLIDVLIVILAVGLLARTEGVRWAPLGLLALLTGEPSGSIAVVVLLLGALRFVERAALRGHPGEAARWARRSAGAVALVLVGWSALGDLQRAALPSMGLSARVDGSGWWSAGLSPSEVPERFTSLTLASQEPAPEEVVARGVASVYRQSKSLKAKEYDNVTLQLDPGAVVQTGPGLPTWQGSAAPNVRLRWEGSVSADQTFRIIAMSPWMVLLQALIHVGALLAVLLRLSQAREEGWLRPGGLPPRPSAPDGTPPTSAGAGVVLLALIGVLGLLAPSSAVAAPDAALLHELDARLSAAPECRPNCVSVGLLDFRVGAPDPKAPAADAALTIGLELHAGEAVSVPLPGPAAIWSPEKVLIDNVPTAALARAADGFVHVRVPAGVHRVVAVGALPARGPLTLQVGLPPQRATMSGEGWALRGLRPDGGVERSVQLVREADGEGRAERSADNLAPWILVRRFVDLGVPWRVRTTVSRVGPSLAPLALRVPLIEGEAVTVDGLQVQDGAVLVSLDQNVSNVEWTGSLPERDQLVLVAPVGVPWTEEWALSCSPVFHCEVEAGAANAVPAPFAHVFEDRWTPQWRPWPGEALHLRVSRPPGAPGQTLTIESAALEVNWRGRQQDVKLQLKIASSQGGQHRVRLPSGATLRKVDLGGSAASLELNDGWLTLPLKPGQQSVDIEWRAEGGASLLVRAPDLDLGAPVSNLQITHRGLDERWLLGAAGGGWGPHALVLPILLIWGCFVVAARQALWMRGLWGWGWGPGALVAVTLGMVGRGVPVLPALLAVALIAAHGAAVARPRPGGWTQLLGLVALGAAPVLLLSLGAAAYQGIARGAVNLVVGNGSTPHELVWTAYRAPSTLMSASVLSLPGWTGQLVYLGWSALLLKLAPAALRRWWSDLRLSLLLPRPPGPPAGGPAAPPAGSPPPPSGSAAELPVQAAPAPDGSADGLAAAAGDVLIAAGALSSAAGWMSDALEPGAGADPGADRRTDPGTEVAVDASPLPPEAPRPEVPRFEAAPSVPRFEAAPPVPRFEAAPVVQSAPVPAAVPIEPFVAPAGPVAAGEPSRSWPYPPVSPVEPPVLPALLPSAAADAQSELNEEDAADADSEMTELPSLPGASAKVQVGDRPLTSPRRTPDLELPDLAPPPTPTDDDEISALLGGIAEPVLALGEE